jgi:hypothetical protein
MTGRRIDNSEIFIVKFQITKPKLQIISKHQIANSTMLNIAGFVKSRHPGENRGPVIIEVINKTGYRLSPV